MYMNTNTFMVTIKAKNLVQLKSGEYVPKNLISKTDS